MLTTVGFAWAGLRHYWRTHLAVACGVAAAVAVLAGALLVGRSVKSSLSALAHARLGQTDFVVIAESPFEEDLGARIAASGGPGISLTAPLLAFDGVVRHETNGRRAGRVLVYGVDARFFAFHGVADSTPDDGDVWLSPDLAEDLDASADTAVIVRVPRPTDVPLDSLFGRKDDLGRSSRLRVSGTLPANQMGEFALGPTQGPIRAAFMSMRRLQRDLGLRGRANVVLADVPEAELRGTRSPRERPPTVREALAAAVTAADLGLKIDVLPEAATVLVESSTGLVPDAVASAASTWASSQSLGSGSVLTWLANSLKIGNRVVPYSLVTAIDPSPAVDADLARALAYERADPAPIVLNDWAAWQLRARAGDHVELEYFRWEDEGRLTTARSFFRVAGIVPMRGLTADRRLAPEYPGITTELSLGDWDPPFPIDLTRVRPIDDEYWRERRTTPKAFIQLRAGQSLWKTKYGQVTSVRIGPVPASQRLDQTAAALRRALARAVDPASAGLTLVDARSQTASAAVGATDFGAYFTYFSFFLVVSGLLLTALFFRLNVEQRLSQVGVLRATGWSLASVRRPFLIEAGVVALAGAALGTIVALAWAALMMVGLRTWWFGAVGTTRLELHVDPMSLGAGALAGALAALISIVVTIDRLSRSSPRDLLTGLRDVRSGARPRVRLTIALAASLGAIALAAAAVTGMAPPAAAFFGAGALVLAGGLAWFSFALSRRSRDAALLRRGSLARLGARNASWRPGRSLVGAGLVAAAVFLLVSVESFRKGRGAGAETGTGGFALIAEASVPFAHDPSAPEGLVELGLAASASDPNLDGVLALPARLRPGDDASCLNLYRPARPRVIGVSERWIRESRFQFAAAQPSTGADPWTLLGPPDAGGIVPAIVDKTSLQYVLHARVGDVITIDEASARPIRLRIVAALDDTILQSEIVIAEAAFARVFPDAEGYRLLFVRVADPAPDRLARLSELIETRLDPHGVDVEDASRRLEAYHRVENTYLSTFQALGGLGLLLGSVGLSAVIARNVLERRRELALLGAAGYRARDLQTVVLTEQLTVVMAGLVIGLLAAAVATGPVLIERGAARAPVALVWVVAVAVTGWLSAALATRRVRRLPVVESLRSE